MKLNYEEKAAAADCQIPACDFLSEGQGKSGNEMLDVMHPMSLRHKGTVTDGLIIRDFKIPGNIHVPTLVLHSKNDGLVSYSHAECMPVNILRVPGLFFMKMAGMA